MNPSRFRTDVPEVRIDKKDFLKFHAGLEVQIELPAGKFLKVGDIIACRLGVIESACEVVRFTISSDAVKDSVVVKKVRMEA